MTGSTKGEKKLFKNLVSKFFFLQKDLQKHSNKKIYLTLRSDNMIKRHRRIPQGQPWYLGQNLYLVV